MHALIFALTISGVVTTNGVPVAGVSITASTPAMHGSPNGYGVKTDDQGRFTLSQIAPARYALSAQTASFLTELTLHAADDRELAIELGPHASGSVYGKVSGLPSPQVWAGGRLYERKATVDAEGNYRVDGLHGSFEIFATSPGLPPVWRRVEIGAGENKRVDLDLGATIPVRGRVTLDGRPIAASMTFHGERTFGLRSWSQRPLVASAIAAPDGTYAVTLSRRGSYELWVEGEELGRRSHRITRTLGDTDRFDIALFSHELSDPETATPLSATLRLRATDARSGAALYAHFDLADAAGNAIEAPSGSSDEAITFALPQGRYRVTVNAVGYAPRTVEVTVPGTFDVDVE